MMSNGITLMRVSSYWYKVITGLIIIVSVGISAYQLRRKSEGAKGLSSGVRKGVSSGVPKVPPTARREAGP
jgi:hypothetical protein